MDLPLTVVSAVVVALTGAIGVLYSQNIKQQKQVETLLAETKLLMGSLAELVRNANNLMAEVRNCMHNCLAEKKARDE